VCRAVPKLDGKAQDSHSVDRLSFFADDGVFNDLEGVGSSGSTGCPHSSAVNSCRLKLTACGIPALSG
jgi:hypothetical protein